MIARVQRVFMIIYIHARLRLHLPRAASRQQPVDPTRRVAMTLRRVMFPLSRERLACVKAAGRNLLGLRPAASLLSFSKKARGLTSGGGALIQSRWCVPATFTFELQLVSFPPNL